MICVVSLQQSLIMEPFFDDKPKKKSKVGAYIPAIMALGMLCFAYKFASSNEFFNLVHPKPLQSMYDYIVGKCCGGVHHKPLRVFMIIL